MVGSDQIVLCKAALIFALARWLLSLALNLLTTSLAQQTSSSCCSPVASSKLRKLRETLSLTTLGKIEHRLPGTHDWSCAVCLDQLRKDSPVWELTTCCHVFHSQCLEKWLCHDDRMTCPLCRASLIAGNRPPVAAAQPSWAVERMLYLFGDDLLP